MTCAIEEPICLPPTKRGDTWRCLFAFKREDLEVPEDQQEPVALTGYSARLQIRKTDRRRSLVVDTATIPSGLVVIPEAGEVLVTVPGANMRIPVGEYVLDLELTPSLGEVLSTPTLILPVSPDVTEGS